MNYYHCKIFKQGGGQFEESSTLQAMATFHLKRRIAIEMQHHHVEALNAIAINQTFVFVHSVYAFPGESFQFC